MLQQAKRRLHWRAAPGLATTTLTRFLNDPTAPMLTLRSLAKIAHVAEVPPPGLPSPHVATAIGGFASEGARYVVASDEDPVDRAIQAMILGRNATDPWKLETRAIEAAGYMRGDIVIVDLNEKPRAGDIVCAQAYLWEKGQAETLFRVYEPPYLIASPSDATLAASLRKPLLVDNDRVIIKGVVVASIRSRFGG